MEHDFEALGFETVTTGRPGTLTFYFLNADSLHFGVVTKDDRFMGEVRFYSDDGRKEFYRFERRSDPLDAVVFVMRRYLNDFTGLNELLRDEVVGRDCDFFYNVVTDTWIQKS